MENLCQLKNYGRGYKKIRMNKLIGITGHALSGKDTFFNLLHNTDDRFVRFALADKLKEDLSDLVFKQFGWDIFNLTFAQKEVIRPIMITYGQAWRKVDPLHWVKIVEKKIDKLFRENNEAGLFGESLYPRRVPVISDVRFENESHFFKEKYGDQFLLVKVIRDKAPEPPQEEKINQPYVDAYVDHFVSWPTVGKELDKLNTHIQDFLVKFGDKVYGNV